MTIKIIDDDGREITVEQLKPSKTDVWCLSNENEIFSRARIERLQQGIMKVFPDECPYLIFIPKGYSLSVVSMLQMVQQWTKILEDAGKKGVELITHKGPRLIKA